MVLGNAWICYSDFGVIGPDLTSYLDLGDALLSGRWHEAANTTWGPAYGIFLACLIRLFSVDPESLATFLALFHFSVTNIVILLTYMVARMLGPLEAEEPSKRFAVPTALFGLCAATIAIIGASRTSPDMCLMACQVAILLGLIHMWLARRGNTRISFGYLLLIGASAGLSCLLKQSYFPFIPIIAAAVWFLSRTQVLRSIFWTAGVALVPLIAWGAFLSVQRGRITIGDNGRWNYSHFVSGIDNRYWINVPPEFGSPVNPPKLLMPEVYSFATPFTHAVAPFHYDLAWWSQGEIGRFTVPSVFRRLSETLPVLGQLFRHKGPFFLALITLFCLYIGCVSVSKKTRYSILLAAGAPLIPVCLYLLVYIELRHVIPLFFSSGVIAICGLLGAGKPTARVQAALFLLGSGAILGAAYDSFIRLRNPVPAEFKAEHYVELGRRLRSLGIEERASLATWGEPGEPHWFSYATFSRVRLTTILRDPKMYVNAESGMVDSALQEVLRRNHVEAIIVAGKGLDLPREFREVIRDFYILPLTSRSSR
jgi:4-amino-4-deoxy-L-arabinose transferase-like glycosyltransferase